MFPLISRPGTADLIDHSCRRIFWGSFHNAGQICAAIKRVYVHTDVYDAFLDAFVDYAKTVKVGNPMEEGVGVGPLQNKMQYDKVK